MSEDSMEELSLAISEAEFTVLAETAVAACKEIVANRKTDDAWVDINKFTSIADTLSNAALNDVEDVINRTESRSHALEANLSSGLAELLSLLTYGVNPGAKQYLPWIGSGGCEIAAIADFVGATANPYAGLTVASPGAVQIENDVIHWLCRMVGFPLPQQNRTDALPSPGGAVLSGGSGATLAAIKAARDWFLYPSPGKSPAEFRDASDKTLELPSSRRYRRNDLKLAAAYVPESRHHCIDETFDTLGLYDQLDRLERDGATVPLDSDFRIDVAKLEEVIANDKKRGLQPWLLIGMAGSTNTGSVDPLNDLAGIAAREGMWFHIDGAYGAPFAMTEMGGGILSGMERADSIVVDPHKLLFMPYGMGAVLVRNKHTLLNSFRGADHPYLDRQPDVDEPCHFSPELTKPFRSLRLWLTLKVVGKTAFRRALDERLVLAKIAQAKLSQVKQIAVGSSPDLSIVRFQYIPRSMRDQNEYDSASEQVGIKTTQLLDVLLREFPKLYLSKARIRRHSGAPPETWIRVAICSFRSCSEDILQVVESINNAAIAVDRQESLSGSATEAL